MLPSEAQHVDGLVQELATLGGGAAQKRLVAAMMQEGVLSQRQSGGGSQLATTLWLQQEKGQGPCERLQLLGLLAARLAGDAALLLQGLDSESTACFKRAAHLLGQLENVPVDAVLAWLSRASPVARKFLLSRMGAQRRRCALAAVLFTALLQQGRGADALRLVRHAPLADKELRPLLREHLVEPWSVHTYMPTWARQAWARLAAARPALCCDLMLELRRRILLATTSRGWPHPCLPMLSLRRALKTLLQSSTQPSFLRRQLLLKGDSSPSFMDMLPSSAWCIGTGLGNVLNAPVRRPFNTFIVNDAVQLLLAHLGGGGGSSSPPAARGGGAGCDGADAAGVDTARHLLLQHALLDPRCAFKLKRAGLLGWLVEQASLETGDESSNPDVTSCCWGWKPDVTLRRRAGLLEQPQQRARLWALYVRDALATWGAGTPQPQCALAGAEDCPPEAVQMLIQSCGAGQRRALYERLYSNLSDPQAVARQLLQRLDALPSDKQARAAAYDDLLSAAPRCAAAAAILLPAVLRRTRNERAEVRAQALMSLGANERSCRSTAPGDSFLCVRSSRCRPLLACLGQAHLALLEAAVTGALAAPDLDGSLSCAVVTLVERAMRLGAEDPARPLLAAALRMYAAAVRRLGTPGSSSGVDGPPLLQLPPAGLPATGSPALSCGPQAESTLGRSADLAAVARAYLAQVLPLVGSRAVGSHVEGAAAEQGCDGSERGADAGSSRVVAAGLRLLNSLVTCCRGEADRAALRALPELASAVQQALRGALQHQGRFDPSDHKPGQAPGLLAWYLSVPDEAEVLARVQALWEPEQTRSAMLRLLLRTKLVQEWSAPEAAGAPAAWWQQLLASQPWALLLVVADALPLAQQLLSGPAGCPLRGALFALRPQPLELLGCVNDYDLEALPAALALGDASPRSEALQRATCAYAGWLGTGAARAAGARVWAVKATLGACVSRSKGQLTLAVGAKPPALQALLRALWMAAALDEGVAMAVRLAAVCLLVRLQGTSCEDLASLARVADLAPAALLLAPRLGHPLAAVHWLVAQMTGDHVPCAAASFKRLAGWLPPRELEQLAADLLATVGLRAAAWQRVVSLLSGLDTPEAQALLEGEMRRPDLTVSMRVGLLNATVPLLGDSAAVDAFWEECAALVEAAATPDNGQQELAMAIAYPPGYSTLGKPVTVQLWWARLALAMVQRTAASQELCHKIVGYFGGSALFKFSSEPGFWQLVLQCTFDLLAAPPPSQSAGWLLYAILAEGMSDGADSAPKATRRARRAAMRRSMQALVDAAAAELAEARGSGSPSGHGGSTLGSPAMCALELILADELTRSCSPWTLGCTVQPLVTRRLLPQYGRHLAQLLAPQDTGLHNLDAWSEGDEQQEQEQEQKQEQQAAPMKVTAAVALRAEKLAAVWGEAAGMVQAEAYAVVLATAAAQTTCWPHGVMGHNSELLRDAGMAAHRAAAALTATAAPGAPGAVRRTMAAAMLASAWGSACDTLRFSGPCTSDEAVRMVLRELREPFAALTAQLRGGGDTLLDALAVALGDAAWRRQLWDGRGDVGDGVQEQITTADQREKVMMAALTAREASKTARKRRRRRPWEPWNL